MNKRFNLLAVSKMNGAMKPVDYNYKKTWFDTQEELDDYRKHLEKQIGCKVYFTVKDFEDGIGEVHK